MSLSCSCADWDPEPGDIGWYEPSDFSTYSGRRAKKCISCGARIAPGDTVGKWRRMKIPKNDVQIAIYGEEGEIPLASHFHCEVCAGLHFSLADLGYCSDPYEDQRQRVREYAEMHPRSSLPARSVSARDNDCDLGEPL